MKKFSVFAVVAAILLMMLLSGCSGDTSGSNPGSTAVNVSFQKSSGKVLAAATLEELKIVSLILDVIPLDHPTTAVQQLNIDLFTAHQQSRTYSYALPALSDNETYLFRIKAFDAQGGMIFCGQTTLLLQPGPNTVNLTAYSFTGFAGLVGQMYNWNSSDGDASEVIFDDMGTGSLPMINATAYLAPGQSGYSFVMTRASAAAGINRIYSGTFDPGTGTGSGTGTNLAGQAVTWTISNPAQPPAQVI